MKKALLLFSLLFATILLFSLLFATIPQIAYAATFLQSTGAGGKGGGGGKGGMGGGFTSGGGGSTPTFINANTAGNLTIVGEASTLTLGFTTGSGHFVVATTYGDLGSLTVAATLEPSGTAMTCPSASVLDGGRNTVAVCHAANAPSGQTSVVWTYVGSNGTVVTDSFMEYGNMSLTAAPVNSATQCVGTFVSTTSWTCGPYTATGNNLVWTTCASSQNPGTAVTITPASPWNNRTSWLPGTQVVTWFFDQLGPSSGSYTGGGNYPNNASGGFYDCETGSYL